MIKALAPKWLAESKAPHLSKWKITLLVIVLIALIETILSQTQQGSQHITKIQGKVKDLSSQATSFLHGPKKPQIIEDTEPACSQVTPEQLGQLQQLEHLSAYAYNGGFPVSEHSRLKPGSAVCIIVAVPQAPLKVYKDGPVPSKGPDSVHLYMNSSTIRISMPPPRPVPGQAGLTEVFLARTMLYFTELKFYDEGAYEIHADVEWANWQWANQWMDDFDNSVTRYTTGLVIPFADQFTRQQELNTFHQANVVSLARERTFPRYINVVHQGPREDLRAARANRPPCSDTLSANAGRWYFSNAHKVQPGLVDEWGFAWDGDHCRLDFFDENDEMDCLADRQIHAFGDSNLRRLSKALISGGRACRNVTDKCQAEDSLLPISKLVGNEDTHRLEEAIEPKYQKWTMSDHEFRDIQFGWNTTLRYGFQRAVTVNYQDWTKRFYDLSALPEDQQQYGIDPDERFLPTFQPGVDLKSGARARMPPGADAPDLVIIGFGAWDEAYAPTFGDFERTLPHYRNAIMEAYPDTPMVLRISHGHCCPHIYNLYRHNSGVRIQHINDIMRKVFQVNEEGTLAMGGRMVVVNSEPLVGRPEDSIDYGEVLNNHIRFSRIRTELQMMLNAICERDRKTGRARLRKRQWTKDELLGVDYSPRLGGAVNSRGVK